MDLQTLQEKYPEATTFKFGDNESLSALLIKLVREGRKSATCGALRDFTEGEEELPVTGRRDIVLNWDGSPALVIETREVICQRFCDVDEAFALKEGENDDLAGWRSDHQIYFERNGGFDEQMMLVCEQFAMVEDVE